MLEYANSSAVAQSILFSVESNFTFSCNSFSTFLRGVKLAGVFINPSNKRFTSASEIAVFGD